MCLTGKVVSELVSSHQARYTHALGGGERFLHLCSYLASQSVSINNQRGFFFPWFNAGLCSLPNSKQVRGQSINLLIVSFRFHSHSIAIPD